MLIGRPKFVLASGSPRRLTLVNQIGIEPDALRPADIDEMPKKGELPRACANRLARQKAETALAAVKLDDELAKSLPYGERLAGMAPLDNGAIGDAIVKYRDLWNAKMSQ